MQGPGVLGVPVGRVAVALEVDRREPERATGEALRHLEHPLLHAELRGERVDLVDYLGGQRAEHQRAQEHDLHATCPELLVAPGQRRWRTRRVTGS